MRYVSGIDLSVTATGVAVAPLDGNTIPAFATATIGVDHLSTLTLPTKIDTLDVLAEQIVKAAAQAGRGVGQGNPWPEAVLMELPSAQRAGTGLTFERGYLYFAVVRMLLRLGICVEQATNNQIKAYVTGKGTATKGAVIDGIARRFPMFDTGGEDGRADAAGAAALCAALRGSPLAELPAAHRDVVTRMLAPTPVKRTRKATR